MSDGLAATGGQCQRERVTAGGDLKQLVLHLCAVLAVRHGLLQVREIGGQDRQERLQLLKLRGAETWALTDLQSPSPANEQLDPRPKTTSITTEISDVNNFDSPTFISLFNHNCDLR
jgi:hypothetical protein